MSQPEPSTSSQAPLTGSATPVGRGVIVNERIGLGLATVLARKNRIEELSRRVKEQFGIDLPLGPRRVTAGDFAFSCTGPGAWLATLERAGYAFASELSEAIKGLASISDQSDGYVVLRLSGPKVRDTLCKLIPVDLHERAFKVGDIASTIAAHIGVTLWRLEDDAAGFATFESAVYRSFSESFRHELSQAGAEFGIWSTAGRP